MVASGVRCSEGAHAVSARRERLASARLYLCAPAFVRAGRLAELIPALVAAGVDVVQLRDRTLDAAALRREAEACAAATQRAGGLFVVNDDVALARACGADGVHLGQRDGAIREARAALGDDVLVGRTTRGGEGLARAADEGADYASVSPVWETPTKPGRPPIGLAAVAAAAREARLPWYALGGIDARRVARVVALGATRVACVRAIADAADPVAAAADLRRRLTTRPRVLTVAGSDSGGGAGIQADARAIAATGGFPLCAVVALTAQSTRGVAAVHGVPPAFVTAQVAVVRDDIGFDGVKTGMLGTAATVAAVAEALDDLDPADEIPVVVDPVLRAEAGSPLMEPGGERAVRDVLLRRATVITPNLFEAQALTGLDSDDSERLARALHERHGCAVLVTGGHGPSADDVLCDAAGVQRIAGVRLAARTTHGAGCTHSATLAALLARGEPLAAAAAAAKHVATLAVAHGLEVGAGAGPVYVSCCGGRPRMPDPDT
jgi:hydroxymethylpyrimidine kinase/phosphomethylpyrimidine kinase/thiamine-phosphate diphosphorylase